MDLSILIPARNEMWLSRTVQDILENIEGDTEVIVIADGSWPDPPINDHPRVHLIYHPVSIGQRAATNEAARISQAKYLIKCDAHCAFDKGFDVKLMADMQDDWTMVPIMRNLHAFDWVCDNCGDRRYQGPTPTSCAKCDNKTSFHRDVRWIAKNNPQSTTYCFDSEPHFQYFNDFKSRSEYKNNIPLTETMSLQGSFFMCTRKKYHELNLCDEAFGSWGSQGIEVAVKTWLSGGRVVCNHKTWYGHMFRTQGGDFGFPYELSGRQVQAAKKFARDLFFTNSWPLQLRPLTWLLDKFWPVPGWTEEEREKLRNRKSPAARAVSSVPAPIEESKAVVITEPVLKPATERKPRIGMVYYTDSQLNEAIASAVLTNLVEVCNGHDVVSVSLKPLKFGKNICLDLRRGHLAMAKQQLTGLQWLEADIAYMVEHDVLYPKSHFDFIPPRKDVFYYDLNWWKVRVDDGQALHFKAKQVSGLCAHKDILIEYYENRVRLIESGEIGGRRHFEPGGSNYRDGYNKLTKHGFETWFAKIPHVDIRHKTAVTRNIFDPSGYRNQVVDWTLADEIPYWGRTKGRFWEFLAEATTKGVFGAT